jgi:hypothetical protein
MLSRSVSGVTCTILKHFLQGLAHASCLQTSVIRLLSSVSIWCCRNSSWTCRGGASPHGWHRGWSQGRQEAHCRRRALSLLPSLRMRPPPLRSRMPLSLCAQPFGSAADKAAIMQNPGGPGVLHLPFVGLGSQRFEQLLA